jgi:hypothetical protein
MIMNQNKLLQTAKDLYNIRCKYNALTYAGRFYAALAVSFAVWSGIFLPILTNINIVDGYLIAVPFWLVLWAGYYITISRKKEKLEIERMNICIGSMTTILPEEIRKSFDWEAIDMRILLDKIIESLWAILLICPVVAIILYGLLWMLWLILQRMID